MNLAFCGQNIWLINRGTFLWIQSIVFKAKMIFCLSVLYYRFRCKMKIFGVWTVDKTSAWIYFFYWPLCTFVSHLICAATKTKCSVNILNCSLFFIIWARRAEWHFVPQLRELVFVVIRKNWRIQTKKIRNFDQRKNFFLKLRKIFRSDFVIWPFGASLGNHFAS